MAHHASRDAPERTISHTMLSRTATSSVAGRSTAMRRLRRRASGAVANQRPYCGTNGCASFLELDLETGIDRCPICGFTRRTH